MKKFTTLYLLLLMSLSVLAARYDNILSISSNTNYRIAIFVDGRQFSQYGQEDIRITDLRSGYHNIRIYKTRRSYGNNANYARQLFYQGNINVRSGHRVNVTINCFGHVYVDEALLGYDDDNDNGDQWNNQPMETLEFNKLKNVIENSRFETTKLSVAKQYIAVNYFTAQQVAELVKLLNFENNKLDLAKYAYRYSVNKDAYFVVNDAFNFNSSKEDLSKYIAQFRK